MKYISIIFVLFLFLCTCISAQDLPGLYKTKRSNELIQELKLKCDSTCILRVKLESLNTDYSDSGIYIIHNDTLTMILKRESKFGIIKFQKNNKELYPIPNISFNELTKDIEIDDKSKLYKKHIKATNKVGRKNKLIQYERFDCK